MKNKADNPSGVRRAGSPTRLILRLVGVVLIVAALVLIGNSAWTLWRADADTSEALQDAEAMLSAARGASIQPATPSATNNPDDNAIPEDDPFVDATDDASPDPSASPDAPGKASNIMGILHFDSLGGRKVPLLEGTSNRDLARGAGHHRRSSQPGQVGNSVVFGHRNTVFRSFGRLEVGDTVRVELPDVTYTYEIVSMKVIDPDNKVIFQYYDYAAMTLVTCYPFNYVGSAPQRYIVVCRLVE